jgi:hypothetical protein
MSYTLALVLSLLASPSVAPAAADSIRPDSKIRATAMRHAADVRKCYETEGLGRNPNLSGAVEVMITILPSGAVSEVGVDVARFKGLGASEVAKCLAKNVRTWTFDKGPYVVESVILPFTLSRDTMGGPPGSRAANQSDHRQ